MAQLLNANSIVTPHLERFLNRVMARARTAIPATSPEAERVRSDISTFIKQESCHYTVHGEFNEMMLRRGYDRLPELEKDVQAHYQGLLARKSLPFLVGYCEGFESLTPAVAGGWFDGSMDRITRNADPDPMNMWRWHIMEEFEHRTVCYDAFNMISGNHLLRVYTYFYQLFSAQKMVGKVYRYLLEVDRRTMTPAEVEQSKKLARRSVIGFLKPIVRAMPLVLRPSYNPRDLPEPQGWAATRDQIESTWVKGRAAPA